MFLISFLILGVGNSFRSSVNLIKFDFNSLTVCVIFSLYPK